MGYQDTLLGFGLCNRNTHNDGYTKWVKILFKSNFVRLGCSKCPGDCKCYDCQTSQSISFEKLKEYEYINVRAILRRPFTSDKGPAVTITFEYGDFDDCYMNFDIYYMDNPKVRWGGGTCFTGFYIAKLEVGQTDNCSINPADFNDLVSLMNKLKEGGTIKPEVEIMLINNCCS